MSMIMPQKLQEILLKEEEERKRRKEASMAMQGLDPNPVKPSLLPSAAPAESTPVDDNTTINVKDLIDADQATQDEAIAKFSEQLKPIKLGSNAADPSGPLIDPGKLIGPKEDYKSVSYDELGSDKEDYKSVSYDELGSNIDSSKVDSSKVDSRKKKEDTTNPNTREVDMDRAKKVDNLKKLMAGISRAADRFAAGITKTDYDSSRYDKSSKTFGSHLKELLAEYDIEAAKVKSATEAATKEREISLKERNHLLNVQKTKNAKDKYSKKGFAYINRAYAKDHGKHFALNKKTETVLTNLTEAMKILDKGKGTGWFNGIRNQTEWSKNPDTKKVDLAGRDAIMETLRPTLGSVFTEAEGERIIATVFAVYLSPEENLRKYKQLFKRLKDVQEFTNKRYEWFARHGTLEGFTYSGNVMLPGQTTVPYGAEDEARDKNLGIDHAAKKAVIAKDFKPVVMADANGNYFDAENKEEYDEAIADGWEEDI